MSISNGLALPNSLANGQTVDAPKLMANFNVLLNALNAALIAPTPGAGANAGSEQIHNLAAGTISSDAVNLGQLAGYAALAGATFTGAIAATALTLSSTPLGISSGGTGSTTAAAALAALGAAANGANTDITSLRESTLISSGGTIAANTLGFRGLPILGTKTTNYAPVLTDAGCAWLMNGTSLTNTIPANASVAFPIGTILCFVNINASALTVAITTDTMTLAGTTTTGNRTVAQNGIFTALKLTATTWLASGSGVT